MSGSASEGPSRRRDLRRNVDPRPAVDSADDAVAAPPSKKRSGLLFLRDVVVILLIAIVVSFLVKTFLIRSFYIPSGSMENTLLLNDRIIVNQLYPDVIPVDHGDIVVFKDPGGWLDNVPPLAEKPPLLAATDWLLSLVGLSQGDENDHLIKRVIGLPGDHVTCCNALGQLSVNGVPVQEPYVVLLSNSNRVSDIDFDVTVPAGHLWVMGDNRYNSRDSRAHLKEPGGGFVPMENVVGRAFVISWPVARWEWLSDYPEVFNDVPAPAETSAALEAPSASEAPPVARQSTDGP